MGVLGIFWEIFKDYMANSSLHGAKFIVDEGYHISERIFWVVCVTISWITSGFLISASLDSFENNAISFVVESSFRDWNTRFPSVIICESKNPDKVQMISEKLWGTEHDFTLEEVLGELAFFRGESYYSLQECGVENPSPNCILGNFSYYADEVRSSCVEALGMCYWNDLKFRCCDYFMPLKTELGLCFALNSIQSDNPNNVKLDMVLNKYTGPGSLRLEVLTEANVYAVGEEDVPHLVTPKSDILAVSPHISYKRQIAIRNIENDPETRDVNVNQRICRYSDENYLDVHKYYSYSACSVQCRKQQQLKVCNCTNHNMPNTPNHLHCDINGLKCLNDNYEELSVVLPEWSTGRKGVVCRDCLPSCTEVDVSVVHDSREKISSVLDKGDKALVEIGTISLPTERYKRNVVRGRLDLVVSIGGATGLFIGASVLSFIELIYYFTIRPYVNYRNQQQQQQRPPQPSQ